MNLKPEKIQNTNPKHSVWNFLIFEHLDLFRISDPSTWLRTGFVLRIFCSWRLCRRGRPLCLPSGWATTGGCPTAFARDMVFPMSYLIQIFKYVWLDFGLSERGAGTSGVVFSANPESKIQNGEVERRGELAVNSLALVVEIIDDDVVAHLIGRGVKDSAGI